VNSELYWVILFSKRDQMLSKQLILAFEELQALADRPVPLLQRNQPTKEYIVDFTVFEHLLMIP